MEESPTTATNGAASTHFGNCSDAQSSTTTISIWKPAGRTGFQYNGTTSVATAADRGKPVCNPSAQSPSGSTRCSSLKSTSSSAPLLSPSRKSHSQVTWFVVISFPTGLTWNTSNDGTGTGATWSTSHNPPGFPTRCWISRKSCDGPARKHSARLYGHSTTWTGSPRWNGRYVFRYSM